MPILYHYSQFKYSGELINSGEFGSYFKALINFKNPYKKLNSENDLSGDDLTKFKSLMKIRENGLSDYSMAEIKAKSDLLGFNDSLKTEMTALAKDADLSAKAATGKLTFAEALKDGKISTNELGDALSNYLKDNNKDEDFNKLAKAAEKGASDYQDAVKDIIDGSDEVGKAIIKAGEDAAKAGTSSTGFFASLSNAAKGFLAYLKSMLPVIAVVGTAFAAWKIFEYSQTGFTRATEKMNTSVSE
mgnify:CR=1 FL=1